MTTQTRFGTFFLLLIMCLASTQAFSEERFPGIRDLMGDDTFEASGLDRLTPEELEKLNAWLVHYTAWEASSPDLRGTTDVRKARNQPIQATIVGPFTGWTGNTRFKLDNGQVWQQRQKKRYRHKDKKSPVAVEITTNIMGFHVMRIVGSNARVGVKLVNP